MNDVKCSDISCRDNLYKEIGYAKEIAANNLKHCADNHDSKVVFKDSVKPVGIFISVIVGLLIAFFGYWNWSIADGQETNKKTGESQDVRIRTLEVDTKGIKKDIESLAKIVEKNVEIQTEQQKAILNAIKDLKKDGDGGG